jgi:protease IV
MVSIPGRTPDVVLEVDLTTLPVDPDPDDTLARLRTRNRPQLRPILRAMHEAAEDNHVLGLIAKIGGVLPWSAMHELRLAVRAFAASGKPTLAWAESFGEDRGGTAGYVLATGFGEIWLQPGGGLALLGVGAEVTFLRGALDRLGIEPQLEQRYEYKNAADQVMRTEFSDAHREAVDRLAESVFTDAVAAIADGRAMSVEAVRSLVDAGPHTAVEARDAGLVDRLGYRDQVYAEMRRRVGDGAQLLFADRWHRPRRPTLPRRRPGHVALVQVHGPIGVGRTRRGAMGRQAGSDSVAAALRAATANPHARAILLHVDSPGGSAVASDTIWREVVRARESGTPVVVSMGELAASGGYYIACPADVIVALPTTLTGSIGVFGGKLVIRDLLDRIGVGTGSVEHGARSLMYSSRRGFTQPERERIAAAVDAIYTDFVGKVADGRHLDVAAVEAIARGRVWTGRDALGHELVDEIGGLRAAAGIARERGRLPDDAPIRPALHVPVHRRLGRPRNSDDPRAIVRAGLPELPGLAEVSAALGLPVGVALRMPPIVIR